MLIVLDPGHGGKDRTNRGPTGYVEADGALAIALAAREFLWSAGVKVRMTRESDKTVELYTRPYLANEWEADLYVSIHTNAAADPNAAGIETYHSLNGEWGNQFYPQAHELALFVQTELARATGFKDRGIKTRLVTREDSPIKGMDYYAVIRRAKRPAIITEVGFHTNPGEEAKLKDAAFLKKSGEAIAMGITGFIGGPPMPLPPLPQKETLIGKIIDEEADVYFRGEYIGQSGMVNGSSTSPLRQLAQDKLGLAVRWTPGRIDID